MIMTRRGALTGLSASAWFFPKRVFGQPRPQAISGDTFRVGDAIYRLDHVRAPATDQPHATASRRALQASLDDPSLTLDPLEEKTRWSEIFVRVQINNVDLAERLLSAGHVRAFPLRDGVLIPPRYRFAEAQARAQALGLWAMPYFRIRNANDLEDCRDTPGDWHIFEGALRAASRTRPRTYLNFGDDYRTDVTATLDNRARRRLEKAGVTFDEMVERTIEVRGYTTWINGPSIAIYGAGQVFMPV